MVKVAAAQIYITKSSEKNLDKIINYIKKASLKKVDIICFPETSLIHNKKKKIVKKISMKKYLEEIKKSCKENKIHCIFGTNILEKNKIYNSAFLIDDKGRVIYKYNKVNLFRSEKNKVISGKKNKIIRTKFGKIGIIICWDISHPEFVKQLGRKGAWVIFCPSYIKNYGRELESYLQIPYVRSFENLCYFVCCDSANKECAQYSIICSPSKIIKKIRNKEGMIIADLDRRKIIGLRKHYRLVWY